MRFRALPSGAFDARVRLKRNRLTAWRLARIAAIVLLAVIAIGSATARGSGTGAPTVAIAGEITFAPGLSYNHVILLWDERLDESVPLVPSDFTVTICPPSPCPGTTYPAASASYLLGGLGGPDALFGDPSGVTFIRLGLPDGVTVNETSSIQIAYQPAATSIRLRDLSLTQAANFAMDASVSNFGIGFDQRRLGAIVDADHGDLVVGSAVNKKVNRLSLVFLGQIDDLIPLPSPTSFTVTVTRSAASFTDVVTLVEAIHPDLGIGILDLVLETEIAYGDTVSVTLNGSEISAKNGGASFGPITDVQANLFVPLNSVALTQATEVTTSVPGPGPTALDPVATTLTSPTRVDVTISEVNVGAEVPPQGYYFIGQRVDITTSVPADALSPFVLRFDIDSSLVAGHTKESIAIFRNGTEVLPCTGPPGQADPTTCVSAREILNVDGDIRITVLTVAASRWNMAFPDTTPPVITSFSSSANPVAVNTSFTVGAVASDNVTVSPTLKYTINGTAIAGATTSLASAGVYDVCVSARDGAGNTSTPSYAATPPSCVLLAVYDPSAGYVTGGGWITSPAGAYVANLSLTGRASFGFVSQYKKGATVPTGQTEFQFQVANLNFHSTAYEWLVVSGARAQYKGTGTINGAGDYAFMLTAIDGQVTGGGGQDKFRIRIWDRVGGGLAYDNQLSVPDSTDPTTVIGGGSIVIHK
jgi:hypothetical protein